MSFVRNSTSKRLDGIDRPYLDIANRLNEWKLKTGVTQLQLSEASGLSMSAISRLYSGTRAPTVELLECLRNKYSVDLNWLITGEEV